MWIDWIPKCNQQTYHPPFVLHVNNKHPVLQWQSESGRKQPRVFPREQGTQGYKIFPSSTKMSYFQIPSNKENLIRGFPSFWRAIHILCNFIVLLISCSVQRNLPNNNIQYGMIYIHFLYTIRVWQRLFYPFLKITPNFL